MGDPPRWWTRVERIGRARWLVTLTLVAFLVRLPVFFRTFTSGDEATYAALATAMLDGQWLYVGAVDHKPPLIATTYALVFRFTSRQGIHAVHAISILVTIATALLIGVLARRVGMGRPAARAASAVYVVWASLGPAKDMLAANGELLMALPAVAALVSVIPSGAARRDKWRTAGAWRWLAAGVLAGVSALFKHQGATIAVPLAWLAWHAGRSASGLRDRLARSIARLAAAALGAALVLGLVVGPYFRQGELQALVFWTWTYPLRYVGSLDASAIAINAATSTSLWLLLSFGPLLAVAAGVARPRAQSALAIVWAASAALGVAAGGRFFLHYYLQALPPLALLAGLGLERLVDAETPGARRQVKLAGALAAVTLAIVWGLNAARDSLDRNRARHDDVYREVGAFIRARSAPDDRILVWGNSPEIYYEARRSMGTRFPFCNYHSGKIWGTAADQPGTPVDPKQGLEPAWQMLVVDMARRRPTFVVDAASAGLDRWEGHEIGHYPRLSAIVDAGYRRVAVVNRVDIYQRHDSLGIAGEANGASR